MNAFRPPSESPKTIPRAVDGTPSFDFNLRNYLILERCQLVVLENPRTTPRDRDKRWPGKPGGQPGREQARVTARPLRQRVPILVEYVSMKIVEHIGIFRLIRLC